MAIRSSSAEWKGSLKEGSGTMKLASGAYEGAYTYASRFESGQGTNPEELIGAAHAGCFSMFLAALLSNAGFEIKHHRRSALARGTHHRADRTEDGGGSSGHQRGGILGARRSGQEELPGLKGTGRYRDYAQGHAGELGLWPADGRIVA
jgi:organic hydroperoxide reductase OsmC/OhrA